MKLSVTRTNNNNMLFSSKRLPLALLGQVLIIHQTSSQLIDERCFKDAGNFGGHFEKGAEFSNHEELFDSNIFKPDMKLYRPYVCVSPEDGHLLGIELTLRTTASDTVTKRQL